MSRDLAHLPSVKTVKPKKRVGRGYGSGKGGHTTGRGNKGYKARYRLNLLFSGTKIKKSWLKRLPLWRGRGRMKSKLKPVAINLGILEKFFKPNEKVTLTALIKKGLIKRREIKRGVKILGKGKIQKPLRVALPCSLKAKEKIIKAGGTVQNSKE